MKANVALLKRNVITLVAVIGMACSRVVANEPPSPPPPNPEQPTCTIPVPTDPPQQCSQDACTGPSNSGGGPGAGGGPGGGSGGAGGPGGSGGGCSSCSGGSPAGGSPAPSIASSFGPSAGDPVNLANGTENYRPAADLTVYNPHGPNVIYQRQFSSAQANDGYGSPGLAPGWTDNFDIKVTSPAGSWGDLTITYANGSHENWTPEVVNNVPTGRIFPPTGSPYYVTGSAGSTPGQWNWLKVMFKDQTEWKWVPRSGDPYTFLFSTVTDRTGHYITITRVSGYPDRIDHVSNDQNTTLLQFSYDTYNNTGKLVWVRNCIDTANQPTVFFLFGVAPGTGLSALTLLKVSTAANSSAIQTPYSDLPTYLTRYYYGYCARNSQPSLHTITVPDPRYTSVTLSSTATINYDASGAVTSLVDANGNQRVYTYNTYDDQTSTYGTKVEIEDSQNNVVQWWIQHFDPNNHNVNLGATDAAGNKTSAIYGQTNNPYRPTQTLDALNHETQYTYDQYGNVLSVTNPCGTATTYTYEYDATYYPLGRLTSVQEGTNLQQPKAATYYTYDQATGLLLTATSPPPYGSGVTNVITVYTYDGLGNILTVTAGEYTQNGTVHTDNAIVTEYNYTSDGNYSQFAAKGQPLRVAVGDNNANVITHSRYDARGNRTSYWDASGNETDTAYNLADQITQVTEPATGDTGNGHVRTVYNYIYTGGPLYRTDLFDEGNHSSAVENTYFTYGKEGERLTVSGSAEPVTYTYDAAYHLASLADGNGNSTYYTYETGTGRLHQVAYPNPDGHSSPYDTTSYTYTADGHVYIRTDGRDLLTTYQYNDCGFVTGIEYTNHSSENVSIGYDDYNRRTSMSDASASYTYTYDDLNNPASVTASFTNGPQDKTITYSYWPNGTRHTMGTPSGTFTYTFDVVGRLSTLANPFSENSAWSYDVNGRLDYQYQANGLQTAYTYNSRGLLGTLQNEVPGVDVYSSFAGPSGGARMTYDAAGNRTAMGVSGTLADSVVHPGNVTYTYTTKNQLYHETSTRVGGTLDQGFGYDGAGNPTTMRGTPNLSYNGDNQRTGTGTYAYDGNGNATTYKATTLTFDVENRMTAYGSVQTAGYNGNGLRAWKTAGGTTTYYLYDGSDLLCEMNAGGTVLATNTWGANGLVSRCAGTTNTFYAFDPQGSVAQRVDASENVVFSDLYDAYGALKTDNSNDPYGYDGQWGYHTDADTGLALCTHRYYDPSNGRWATRDPIGYRGGMNLYSYIGGRPVVGIDPSGKQPCSKIFDKIKFSDACVEACKSVLPPSLQKTKKGEGICQAICTAWTYKGQGTCEWLQGYCVKKQGTAWYGPCCALYGVICTHGEDY